MTHELSPRTPAQPSGGCCPLVGIGASAGGLDAFRRLIQTLPADTGMAYVLVQHLDPRRESVLVSLLAGATKMAVSQVRHGERARPDRIYVVPPSTTPTVSAGCFSLEPRSGPGEPFLPIDALFSSLARMQGSQAIGVVLSGMGTDGTRGLQVIEEAGGIAIVQDPGSAEYDAMPRHAIASGAVDFVLAPEDIGHALGRLSRHLVPSTAPRLERVAHVLDERTSAGDLARVLGQLRLATHADLGAYKKTTLARRVARRMAVHRLDTYAAYAALLERHPEEASALLEDCLIGVTSFFRDPSVFEALSTAATTALLERQPPTSPIRVWVAGCATGEEAYSVAICLSERIAATGRALGLEVFATDLSERALARARAGVYPDSISKDVYAERLERFYRLYAASASVPGPARTTRAEGAPGRTPSRHAVALEVPREADRILLARYSPAAVVVDGALRVLEFRGDTDPFLEHGHGKARLELHRLLRKDLLVEVRAAIEEVRRTDAPARRVDLDALLHEHEAALEELRSRNEEALSANEEMQSVNEELQGAKEEIQSANEELATLNQKLSDRNAELIASNHEIRDALASANALIESVRQPLLVLNADLRVERANAAFEETFLSSGAQAHGLHITEISGGQWNLPVVTQALEATLLQKKPLERLVVEIPSSLGPRTLWLAAQELHLARGAQRHLLVSFDDRTEAQRIERQREALVSLAEDARRRAEASDLLKDQFVATVSHELRGPLNVISGWTNILLGAGPNPEPAMLARALAAIGRGVSAQGRLLSDLLDHSRVVTGGLVLERGPVDLVTLAQTALDSVRSAAKAKGVAVELSGARAQSIVFGDADRLQQVLWNLFFNAVKFTPRGGSVHVTVSREGSHTCLVVRDDGVGIPPEFLPRVFDRFRQAEGASNRSQPGLGLGLTLVRELVELHGGTVTAESEGVGHGCTFRLRLPVAAVLLESPAAVAATLSELEPTTESPTGESPARLPGGALRGLELLVVDDEQDARDAVGGVLESQGGSVRVASSAAAAMAKIAEAMPDVIVSDLGMPGEDGFAFMRRLRALPAREGGDVPAIAVSGYSTAADRRRALEAGFQFHLGKPVAPAELVSAIVRLPRRA